MAPFGRALRAFFDGDIAATLLVRRDDGLEVPLPIKHFFREPAEFTPIERLALESCRGRVLDLGAGTGMHSLALQARGLAVEAVDVSPDAVSIMARRGVHHVSCTDVHSFGGAGFDTILMLGHSVGMAGDLAGLDRLLARARSLLVAGGQLLLDSLDVTCDPTHAAYHEANRHAGRYAGEVRMQFEYQGQAGPVSPWLHVDPHVLAAHAATAGMDCEVLLDAGRGEYLARLQDVRSTRQRSRQEPTHRGHEPL